MQLQPKSFPRFFSIFHPETTCSRILIAFCLLASLAKPTWAKANRVHKYFVYVGTYSVRGSRGIYAYSFDPANGHLARLGLQAETINPSYITVAPNRPFLYAVSEIDNYQGQQSGALSAYRTDAKTGALTLLNRVSSLGTGPCYLSLDKTGKFAFSANYDSGNVAVFPLLPDGKLGDASASVQQRGSSINADRQKGPHAHCIETTFDNRYVIVADLGLDQLLVYKFDSTQGSLSPSAPAYEKVQGGAGPRHFVFHPNHGYLYLVNEMESSVSVFSYDAKQGTLQEKQTISALSQDFKQKSDAAEIQIDTAGRFVYVSNRGPDSITVFRVSPTNGTLEVVETVPSGGKTPRYFAIDPSGKFLLVANQDSDNIVTFRIDRKSGKLSKVSETGSVISPVSLAFLEAK